jgi:phage shock protein PspC (stress-responsive transcriptional regulator)
MNRRLYRSTRDRIFTGVAGGMAETWDLDPAIVRIGWVLLTLLTGGVLLIVYIVMALVVPVRPAGMPVGGSGGPGPDGAPAGPDQRPAGRSDHTGGAVFGALLILVGMWFLIREYLNLDLGRLWPFAVIAIGVVLVLLALARPRRA